MSEKKIAVPEGMLEETKQALRGLNIIASLGEAVTVGLETALLWLAEHPMRPTYEQFGEMSRHFQTSNHGATCEDYCEEWQRRMFFAPGPEVAEDIKDLLVDELSNDWRGSEFNEAVIEAFRRGQNAIQTTNRN